MIVKGIIKKGEYFDSVTLMMGSRKIRETKGVIDSSIVMGTKENKAILKASGLLLDIFSKCNDADMLIVIKAESEKIADEILGNIDNILKSLRKKEDKGGAASARTIEAATKILPDANLAIISIAGKYAAEEAMKCLKRGLHVLIFSDNVSLEDEIKLKKYGRDKGLLVMGPDCGTAIINGAPLAFANDVERGNIGIVAASGTGLQEVSCIISNLGGGISQAIGTGGRDVKKDVGGIMFIEGIKLLLNDPQTKVLLLVSKPPHEEVLKKISAVLKKARKPIVSVFIGAKSKDGFGFPGIVANSLEEGAVFANTLASNGTIRDTLQALSQKIEKISSDAEKSGTKFNKKEKYLRALFSGGTFCAEAQSMMSEIINDIYSNAPICDSRKLKDANISEKNTIFDLGEDEFTVGRPHPMIDYSLRNDRIIREAKDPETAVILLDIVLGYGSNMNPVADIKTAITEAQKIAKKDGRNLVFSCCITGTEKDPQVRSEVIAAMKKLGVHVFDSNFAACTFAAQIIRNLT